MGTVDVNASEPLIEEDSEGSWAEDGIGVVSVATFGDGEIDRVSVGSADTPSIFEVVVKVAGVEDTVCDNCTIRSIMVPNSEMTEGHS